MWFTQDEVGSAVDLSGVDAWDWAWAGIIVVAAFVISRLIAFAVRKVLSHSAHAAYGARVVARFVGYLIIVFGFVYALSRLGVDLLPLLGALGIAGIALAFALQDILENFVAGVILLVRRPFTPGDQVEVGGIEGTVEDITLRTVQIRTFDGEEVYVPNGSVLSNAITNSTENGLKRTAIDVGVEYDADLDAATAALLRAVNSVDEVRDDPAPQAFVHKFTDNSIDFAVRWWHSPERAVMWRTRDGVAKAIKRELDAAGIGIPFPQRVLQGSVTIASSE